LTGFTLLHTHRFVGLTLLNFFDTVNYLLIELIFLALYAALRQVNRTCITIATAPAFVGIAVYLASNQAFSILPLSDRYAAATTDAQRSMLLAAGQVLLAIRDPNAAATNRDLCAAVVALADWPLKESTGRALLPAMKGARPTKKTEPFDEWH